LSAVILKIQTVFWGMSPFKKTVFCVALFAFVVELVLRTFARRSRAYVLWTNGMEAVGGFWTAILLSVVYFVTVAPINLFHRLSGKDPLDRSLKLEASYWRSHQPNPLGAEAAARHQF
jgi:hypothetical protein